jgi:hypothetical protein
MADIPPPPPPPQEQIPQHTPPAAPPQYQAPPGYQPPPSPGYMPQPIAPSSGGGLNLGMQFVGARSSIIVGIIGIVVPVVWAIVSGGTQTFYFYVLPIFGIIYGIRAIMRGFPIGGGIGVALNVIAGLVSLTASGLINPGS